MIKIFKEKDVKQEIAELKKYLIRDFFIKVDQWAKQGNESQKYLIKNLGKTSSIESICRLSKRSYRNVIIILQTTIMHIISDFDNTIFLNNATQFENAVMEKTTMILTSKREWILETFNSEV